jgi:hypothetical protein
VIDGSNGQILKTFGYGTSDTFGQPVFADNYLFVASKSRGLREYSAG